MASIKVLAGRKLTKNVKFMGEDVTIFKLSLGQVEDIQAKAKEAQSDTSGVDQMAILKYVVGLAVEGGAELSEDDFRTFPPDELNTLSNHIMEFSGMSAKTGETDPNA